MIKRSESHITDTKAARLVLAQLNEDWLVRSLDERDYGIDLQLERFNGENPTGDFIFAQVKGTAKKFKNSVKFSTLKTDTIKYSQMFNVPFFLFYTSIASSETKFVWLQKYADTKLKIDIPKWGDQKTVTIEFPPENDLKKNIDKVINIIQRDRFKRIGVKFLTLFEGLILHAGSVIDTGELDVSEYCAMVSSDIIAMTSFIGEFGNTLDIDAHKDLKKLPIAFENIFKSRKISQADKSLIKRCIENLETIKIAFLYADDQDEFLSGMIGHDPY